jgi:hypothetical protein
MDLVETLERPPVAEGTVVPVRETGRDLDSILEAADRILDGLEPVEAEEYLQQNRQTGGE